MIRSRSRNPTSSASARVRVRRSAGARCPCASNASMIWSPILITGLSAVIGSWKIIAMRRPRNVRHSAAGSFSKSRPSKRIAPATARISLGSRPITAEAQTVLPEPDSPTTQRICRGCSASETPSTAKARSASAGSASVSCSIDRIASAAVSLMVSDPTSFLFPSPLRRQRDAVLAMVRGAIHDAADGIDLHRLETSKRLVRPNHTMTTCDEIVGDRAGHRRFERQRAVEGKTARRVRGLLDVEAAVEHAAQDLHVSGGLILSTHHAKRHDGFAILRQHARNDGVKRTLSWRDGVGMALDEAEARTAILQQHARTRGVDTAAEGE